MAPYDYPNNRPSIVPPARLPPSKRPLPLISTSTTHRPLIEPGDPLPRPKPRSAALQHNLQASLQQTHLQNLQQKEASTSLILHKLPFARIVREVCQELVPAGMEMRWQSRAILCLQEAAEAHLEHVFVMADLKAGREARGVLGEGDLRAVAGRGGGGG